MKTELIEDGFRSQPLVAGRGVFSSPFPIGGWSSQNFAGNNGACGALGQPKVQSSSFVSWLPVRMYVISNLERLLAFPDARDSRLGILSKLKAVKHCPMLLTFFGPSNEIW